eukprot:3168922-Pyramimonas_sp.AAC.1
MGTYGKWMGNTYISGSRLVVTPSVAYLEASTKLPVEPSAAYSAPENTTTRSSLRQAGNATTCY